MAKIIGRKNEQTILKKILQSKNAELVAIYGRRRIGKTFLVREMFSSWSRYFELTGKKQAPLKEQLKNFAEAFSKAYYPGVALVPPRSWRDAFTLLTGEMEKAPSKKYILFFDELPWLAGPKGGFVQAFDHCWNSYWSRMVNVKVILCGSAASWMLEHLIQAKGGLHNRITRTIHLEPFNLKETQEYLRSRQIRLNAKQVLDLYMVMGGVPYYLSFVEKGKSAEQNIQDICFSNNGPLLTEFERLFRSLFESAEIHLRLIREIARKRDGISRDELLQKSGMTSGGTFNKRIDELEAAGFIRGFIPYQHQKKAQYFRLIDEYSTFYLTWIDPVASKGFPQINYWKACLHSGSWSSWAGYAFESVCFKHLPQILRALRLESIPCEVGSWRFIPKKGVKQQGVQIDLLFDRQDQAVTICEIKYSSGKYSIDKSYAKELHHKLEVFQERTDKQLFLALISTFGVKKNLWSEDLVSAEATLKDLSDL
ncbi:MAG TPA: ATP-binding protein [Chlamydiales bacterium]|nr:ATP-binding protein [Chlamydiales bacterium]